YPMAAPKAPPGYYFDVPGNVILLPVPETYGAEIGYDQEQIIMTSDRGNRFVYDQFRRIHMKLPFKLVGPQIFALQALHIAAHSSEIPFWFWYDTSDPASTAFLCRKEKVFHPKEMADPVWVSGEEFPVWDYILDIAEEPPPGSLIP